MKTPPKTYDEYRAQIGKPLPPAAPKSYEEWDRLNPDQRYQILFPKPTKGDK